MANAPYPARPPRGVFAIKFIRIMTKKCVANELGPQVFTLLSVIVTTEDARGYTGAVTYFNHQLMPLIGAGSEDALAKTRDKAIRAGWLHYVPGRKSVPGRYFVTVPSRHAATDDGPTDEDPEDTCTRTDAGTSGGESRGESSGTSETGSVFPRTDAGTSRGEAEDKSGPFLPVPVPVPIAASAADPAPPPGKVPGKKKAAPAGPPKPRRPNPLFDAITRVTNSDPAIDGGHIGKTAAALARGDPPFTPEEVLEFAGCWRQVLPWATPDKQPLLTIGIVQNHITKMRAWRRGQPAPVVKRAADNPKLAPDRLTDCPPMETPDGSK